MSLVVHARSEHARGAAAARRLRTRAHRYLAALGIRDAELSIVVVTDAAIRRLNRRWRGKDRATDVLSFPVGGPPGPIAALEVRTISTFRVAGGIAFGRSVSRWV